MAAGRGGAARPEETLRPFHDRAAEAEARLANLEALLFNKDRLNSESETNSSATKDLQSKLDAANADYLAEKEKNKKLVMENEKLQYRISHLIRALKEVDSR